MKLMIFVLFIFHLTAKMLAEDTCVWYGQCGHNSFGEAINCLDHNPARLFNHTDALIMQEFKNYCPSLADANGDFYLCCDDEQVNHLINGLQLPRYLLERCPSCWRNFREFTCQVACSSKQSRFMIVEKTERVENSSKEMVLGVQYLVTNLFANSLFDSCYNVTNPTIGNAALDLMCGPWDQQYCTPEKWLSYMGDVDNGVAPFSINVTLWDQGEVNLDLKTYRPMNSTTFPCNVGFDGGKPCSCRDCEASCP